MFLDIALRGDSNLQQLAAAYLTIISRGRQLPDFSHAGGDYLSSDTGLHRPAKLQPLRYSRAFVRTRVRTGKQGDRNEDWQLHICRLPVAPQACLKSQRSEKARWLDELLLHQICTMS